MLHAAANATLNRYARYLVIVAMTIGAFMMAGVLDAPAAEAQAGPIAPTSCTVSWSGSTATVTWVPANNDGANRYVLERRVNGANWQWTDRINIGEPLSSTFTAVSGDTVVFRIKSRDSADANSSYRTCNPVGGSLLAPVSCSFTRSGNTATINWVAANNDGANRYVIERNRNNLGWFWADRINIGNPLTASNSVAAADSVQFRVKSRNAADDNSSYTTCTEAGGAPLAPVSCSFTRSGNTATITWVAANNDGANRYVIERNRNNLGWFWAARINIGNPLTATNSVAAGDTVAFRIKSRNAADDNSGYTTCNQVGAGWITQARWDFNQTSGPVIDSVANFDGTIGVDQHPGTLVRQGGAARFDGEPGSIVLIPVDGASSDFNPAGGELRWTTRFSMTANQIQAAIDNQNDPNTPGTSWNVMQRAFATNPDGQWKTQMVVRSGKVYAQCIVRDGRGDANGGVLTKRSSVEVVAGVQHTIQCEFDDSANTLEVTFDATVEPLATAPGGFLAVNPMGTTTCSGGNKALGDVITLGNKPFCGNASITADDTFEGTIYWAEVQKKS